jgi:hypothetical protein
MPSDNNDPTMRLNSLVPLADSEAVLADLRSMTLAPVRGSLTLRDLELGLGKAVAGPDEPTPTESGVLQALQGLMTQYPSLADHASTAAQATKSLMQRLDEQLGSANTVDLSPLVKLVQVLSLAIRRLSPEGDGTDADETVGAAEAHTAPARAATVAGGGGISSRADALRELERVCEWLERHEPANPAPILIRRAQRLMNKSFLEIIRDLAPDGLAQVENLSPQPPQVADPYGASHGHQQSEIHRPQSCAPRPDRIRRRALRRRKEGAAALRDGRDVRLVGQARRAAGPVADRKFLEVDVDNFDSRMKSMKPRVAFQVPNTLTGEGNIAVDITFENMDDFSPRPWRPRSTA